MPSPERRRLRRGAGGTTVVVFIGCSLRWLCRPAGVFALGGPGCVLGSVALTRTSRRFGLPCCSKERRNLNSVALGALVTALQHERGYERVDERRDAVSEREYLVSGSFPCACDRGAHLVRFGLGPPPRRKVGARWANRRRGDQFVGQDVQAQAAYLGRDHSH